MIDLKGKKIFVLTNVELGWDCVTDVYLAESEEEVIEYLKSIDSYNEDCDFLHEKSLRVVKSKSEIRDEKIEVIVDGKQG
jgi:hypothetical protein